MSDVITVPIEEFEATVFERLMSLDSTQRASAYVQVNRWRWPDFMADLKPDHWDDIPSRDKYEMPSQQTLSRLLQMTTTEFERSRQWWREALGRTDEAHMAWWKENYAHAN